jgi:alpha/beta superfamily hydrolase
VKFSRPQPTLLPGPAGQLEALVSGPPGDTAAVEYFAVVCHPHPLYGGTLDNKVVYILARAFEECGAATIRFNFRGVGSSAGGYDGGRGETEDALAAIAYGRARWNGARLWLAGFSFGAAVAVRAAARAEPDKLVLVAPGVTRMAMDDVPSPRCPWLLVQGDADEVIEPEEVLQWAQRQSVPAQIRRCPGAGHFFHGRLHELRAAVAGFVRAAK